MNYIASVFLKNCYFFLKLDSLFTSAGPKTVKLEVRAAEFPVVVHWPASGDFLATEELAIDPVSWLRAVLGLVICVQKV